jgi:multiple RNA-binding domain-containing protein 1
LESSTVFIKNISFKTSRDALERHVLQAAGQGPGTIKSTKIAQRKGKDGTMLSAGYGFIECSSEDVALKIISKLQGVPLDGHGLVLQLARSGDKGNKREQGKALPAASNARPASKLVVRNVAFEAKRNDLIDLFSPFGEIKSCRIPRKFDGQHRGFAFVEFASAQEAKAAMEAVAGSHLYGRRLVLEWAEQDDGLEQIREKTARRFQRQTEEHRSSQRKKAKT